MQTSHHDEDRWHEQLANNDEAQALADQRRRERERVSAWTKRQQEDIARRAKSQALRNRDRYMREQRAIWRSMIQRIEPGPSQHWAARLWRAFVRHL